MSAFHGRSVLIRLKSELVTCDSVELNVLRGAAKRLAFETYCEVFISLSGKETIVAFVTINARCTCLLSELV